jgi:two-component system sensor histidine kinase PilS (NtrC family)
MHSGLLMADLAGRIRFVNEFGLGILRMGLPQVSGLTLTDVFGASLEPSSLQARVANPALSRFELTYRPPGGDEVELGFSASPLAASEGSSGGYLLVFQDLTQIRRLEREVRAKEKLAAAGEMAARLAHEIRNPLGSISGSAQVLMAEPNIASEQQRLLAIIRRESQRLSDTLNDFLMQSRPGPDRSGPVNVASVVNEAVTLLRNGPEAKAGHVIEVEADAGPHVCLADPDKVAQVIWNLARNGLEAMPAGGHLRVSVTRRGEEVVLAVRDQGVGIGRDEQRRIFEPFQTGARGTGLGLAIVYNLVRDCHGDITVRSLPSEGTEVRVRLPLLSSALPA